MEIKIECFHFDRGNQITDYRNSIKVDKVFSFPFDQMCYSLSLLYPKSTFITFTCPTLYDNK